MDSSNDWLPQSRLLHSHCYRMPLLPRVPNDSRCNLFYSRSLYRRSASHRGNTLLIVQAKRLPTTFDTSDRAVVDKELHPGIENVRPFQSLLSLFAQIPISQPPNPPIVPKNGPPTAISMTAASNPVPQEPVPAGRLAE